MDVPVPAASLHRAVVGFAAGTLVIFFAARFLANSAADLSAQLGVSTGLIGITLLALTTSLPELVVGISAIRAGAFDLAVGNLLGSNCFNMAILLALDIADGPEPLLAHVQPGLLLGALLAIVLMSAALVDTLHTADRRAPAIEPGPWLLVATYALGILLTYVSAR
jgi:cation:H+ antiporter